MQNGHKLEFHCEHCETPILFSVLDGDSLIDIVICEGCGKKYQFDDALLKLLKKFEALCRQINASSEILGHSSIAIDVGSHHVKVPFNILLTRLSSVMDLNLNGKKHSITFRVEPLRDVPDADRAKSILH